MAHDNLEGKISDLDMYVKIKNESSGIEETNLLYDIYVTIKKSVDEKKSATNAYYSFECSFNVLYHALQNTSKYLELVRYTRDFLKKTSRHELDELKEIADVVFNCIELAPFDSSIFGRDSAESSIKIIKTFYDQSAELKSIDKKSYRTRLSEIHAKIDEASKTFINSDDSFKYISGLIERYGKDKVCQEQIFQKRWSNRQYL